MKTAMTLGLAALLAMAGAAMADQPMVLTDAQLDRATAGNGSSKEPAYLTVHISPEFGEGPSITFGDGVRGARSLAWGDSVIQFFSAPSPDIEVIPPAPGSGR